MGHLAFLNKFLMVLMVQHVLLLRFLVDNGASGESTKPKLFGKFKNSFDVN